MSRYSVNEEELRKGQQLLLHVGNKLEAMARNVENAKESLMGYTGYGIERQRYTLETQKNVLVLQIENMERLRTCIQQVIDRTRTANQEAKAELQNSELNTGFKTAADIIAAEQAKRELEERKRREEEERKKAEQEAAANRNPGNTGGSPGGGKVNNTNTAFWNSMVGNTVADLNGECYRSGNLSYRAGFEGQCTWYVYGRFLETTGIALNYANAARRWISDNANDSRVNVVYGMDNVPYPAIAVCETDAYSTVGHVLFIEGAEYNADGTVANVFLTESNSGYDPTGRCVVQKVSFEEYKRRYWVTGYLTAR